MYKPVHHEAFEPQTAGLGSGLEGFGQKEDGRKSTNLHQEMIGYQKSIKPRSKIRRLSWLLKFGMFTSFFALTLAIIFITWIWWTSHDDPSWRRWVLTPNRLSLSVTLTGVAIRTAVGVLATFATAMIASVAVEQHGVHLHAIAQVSIARFASGGPMSLLFAALNASGLDTMARIIVLVLVLTTFTIQLTSTLLVSDLKPGHIVSFPKQVPNTFTFDKGSNGNAVTMMQSPTAVDSFTRDYWIQSPRFAETFAEHSESAAQAEGLDDTGPTVRAFIPLAMQGDREVLHEFRGMARVIDSRVVCVRPQLTEIRLCLDHSKPPQLNICGSGRLDRSAGLNASGVLHDGWSSSGFKFMCPFMEYTRPEYVWQLCKPESSLGDFDSSLYDNTRSSSTVLIWDSGWAGRQKFFRDENSTVVQLNSTKSGPWLQPTLQITSPDNTTRNSVSFKMTICLQPGSYQAIEYLNISAAGPMNRTEPTYKWNTERAVYDTSAVRTQIGAVANARYISPLDRQIMSISPDSINSSLAEARSSNSSYKYYDGLFFPPLYDLYRLYNTPVALCPNCAVGIETSYRITDILHAVIFSDTIKETNSPALALQAVYFTLARTVYYDLINAFEPIGNATIVTFELTSIPQLFRGYWIVMGMLGVFVLVFSVVGVLFDSTRFSLPDNAWHTIAQISESSEMSGVLREARMATDQAIEHFIDGSQPSTGYVERISNFLGSLRKPSTAGVSSFTIQPKKERPRFVVRDGVFVRASGVGTDVELERMDSRRHLTVPDAERQFDRESRDTDTMLLSSPNRAFL